MAKRIEHGGLPLSELVECMQGSLEGDPQASVLGICAFDSPKEGHIAFTNKSSAESIQKDKSLESLAALVVPADFEEAAQLSIPLVRVQTPLSAIVSIIPKFYEPSIPSVAIHESAHVHPSAKIGQNVSIGPFCVVDEDATVGDNSVLHAHVVLYPRVTVGESSTIHACAVIREDCSVGAHSVVQSGAVIGSDGFGYVPDKEVGLRSIPQVGTVQLHDRVDVGANTCIDRATLGTTTIETGSKVDNLVQIGHNTRIGQHSILCALAGIAGSCNIGNGVVLGGNTGVADHVYIADGARFSGKSGIIGNIPEKGDYAGHPTVPAAKWRRQSVLLRQLPEVMKKLKKALADK